MTVKDSDILALVGGAMLPKYGTSTRRTALIGRRGEAIKETFTRAAPDAYYLDRNGVLRKATTNVPRFTYLDPLSSGTKHPYYSLEDTRTNICLQSSNFGTTWVAAGTPTRTPAAHTASGVTLDLIGDDDAGAAESYSQTIAFTGNAVKAVSIHVKQGSSVATFLRVRDDTAGVNRLAMLVTWTAGLPAVAVTTGTYVGYETLADGVFRLLLLTTTITAASTHRVFVYPASASVGPSNTETGTLYAGGVQIENSLFHSSYIPTTTATVTRARDVASIPFPHPPQALTVYYRGVERGTVIDLTARNLLQIGAGAGMLSAVLGPNAGDGRYVFHAGGLSGAIMGVGAFPTYGQLFEIRATLTAAGVFSINQSINLAAEVAGSTTGSTPILSAWGSQLLYLNANEGTTETGHAAIDTIAVVKGFPTLTELRALRV